MGDVVDMRTRRIIATGKRIGGVQSVVCASDVEGQDDRFPDVPIAPVTVRGIEKALKRVYGDLNSSRNCRET